MGGLAHTELPYLIIRPAGTFPSESNLLRRNRLVLICRKFAFPSTSLGDRDPSIIQRRRSFPGRDPFSRRELLSGRSPSQKRGMCSNRHSSWRLPFVPHPQPPFGRAQKRSNWSLSNALGEIAPSPSPRFRYDRDTFAWKYPRSATPIEDHSRYVSGRSG